MLKKLIFALGLAAVCFGGMQAQSDTDNIPTIKVGTAKGYTVNWTFSALSLGKNEYELTFAAKIGGDAHIYSQFIGNDGPVPTSITYDSKHQQLLGKSTESSSKPEQRIEGMDPIFEMNLIKYKKDMTIKQRVKVLPEDLNKPIVGYVTCMVCDHEKCFPPIDQEFNIKLFTSLPPDSE